jgi:hypothetical protein
MFFCRIDMKGKSRFMKYLILILLLLPAIAADAGEVVAVPGTRVGLVPPEGFQKADRFPGFTQAETNASIMVTEIPGPFSQVSAGFTPGGLKSRDMVLLKKEPITVNGQPGILLHVSQNAYGVRYLKWITIIGDERHTIMITASFPAELEKRLSEPLRSAVATPQVLADPPAQQDPVGFTFELTPAEGLQVARRMGNNLLLTRDGEFPARNPTDPILVAGASASQGLAIQNKRDFATARALSISTLKSLHIKETTPVTIAGLNGYEILARGIDKQTGEKMFVCQTMLFGNTDYYLIQGLARSAEQGAYLPVFRETMKSFKLKRP